MSSDLDPELRAFVVDYIGSVVQLEALLLLRRSGAEWTAEALARELRIEVQPAAEQLQELCHRGILDCAGDPARFRYAPGHASHDPLIARLAQTYEDRRVSVIALIYSTPRPTVKVFADAFRLRRDDDG